MLHVHKCGAAVIATRPQSGRIALPRLSRCTVDRAGSAGKLSGCAGFSVRMFQSGRSIGIVYVLSDDWIEVFFVEFGFLVSPALLGGIQRREWKFQCADFGPRFHSAADDAANPAADAGPELSTNE